MKTINEWLEWIANQQPAEMMLGLERVRAVAERLGVLRLNCPVITVGGTNGKGSTVATLDAIYRVAGYRVGTFTSPILFRHNEYVHIDGDEVTDELFCQAYQQIAAAQQGIALTPFEFHTVAALWMFKNAMDPRDIVILEVGLGGRLDAVNIIDADVAIVTSIDIDHADWLGDSREKIAYEKAGIFRSNKPAICGDRHPPQTLIAHAKKIDAKLFCIGKEFDTETISHLPKNSLYPPNTASAFMAVTLLQPTLPVTRQAIEQGLQQINLIGRVQIIPGAITEIYDVSHNPAAVAHLAKCIQAIPCTGKTIAVFSMLADKDIAESVKQIASLIDEWHIASLKVKRAANLEQLKTALNNVQQEIFPYATINEAYYAAKNCAKAGDRIIVFGSFHTVAAILTTE